MRIVSRRVTPVDLLVTVSVAVVASGVLADLVHHHVRPFEGLHLLLSLSSEANIPTWWSAMLLLTGASLAGLGALTVRRAGRPSTEATGWTSVAAALTFLSLDEAVQVHERLALVAGFLPATPTYQWVVPGALLAVVGLTGLVATSRALPRPVRRGLALAIALYLGGAVGVEGVNGWVARTSGVGDLYRLSTALEESLEMAGCLIAVATLLAHLQQVRRVALPSGRQVALVLATVWLLVAGTALTVALLVRVDPELPMGYHVLLWREGNTTTWIQSGVWWCAAAAFLLAASRRSGGRRLALTGAAGWAVLISATEMGTVHELVGRITVPPEPFWGGPRWAPVALGAALLAVVSLRLGRAHLPKSLAGRLTGALTLLAVAAVSGDMLDARLVADGSFTLRVVGSTFSETIEMLAGGVVLVLALALSRPTLVDPPSSEPAEEQAVGARPEHSARQASKEAHTDFPTSAVTSTPQSRLTVSMIAIPRPATSSGWALTRTGFFTEPSPTASTTASG